MNRELVIRVRAPDGQYRLNVMSRDTYGELLLQVIPTPLSLPKNSAFPSAISSSPARTTNLSASRKAISWEISPISSMVPF